MNKTNEPCAAVVLIRAQGEQMRRKLEEYEVKKDCFGYRADASAVRLSRCTAALSTAGFTRRQSNLKEIGNDTRSWEPENSISVLEYLERKGVIAGGQEKT